MNNFGYCPERGDIVSISFDPSLGHEQKGTRPGLVLSDISYNYATQMCVVVPITSKVKGLGFEVLLTGQKTVGAVLADHLRSYDWNIRKPVFIEKINPDTLENVLSKAGKLFA